MKRITVFLAAAIALGGCTWQVRMMPRDSGKVYVGTGKGDGLGGGSVSIQIEGRTFTGPVMRVGSNDSFGFFQTYGGRGPGALGMAQSFGGTVAVKAMLSSPDNSGLRCDLTGDGQGHLGGICLDDQGRVYDLLANR